MLQAWADIDSAMTAFKKCSISNARNGNKDSVVFEDEWNSDSDGDPFANTDEELSYDDTDVNV